MGLSDIFSSSHSASQQPQATDLNLEKEEVFRKLTEELVQVREKNAKLETSQRIAIAERKEAVYRMKDLEDSLRMKEGILDNLERRIEHLENENNRLLSVETELSLLREDQLLHPLSSSDASFRYSQLSSLFTQLRDTLSCAVCYEPYIKDQAVSLMCGHSFCRDCFTNWEIRHVEAWKMNPNQQGVYPGADCPECRSKEVRRGKVRIWALEETVRLVDRAVREIEKNQFTPEKKEEIVSAIEVDDLISMEEEDGVEEAKGETIEGGGNELNEEGDSHHSTSTIDPEQPRSDGASISPSSHVQTPSASTSSSPETPFFESLQPTSSSSSRSNDPLPSSHTLDVSPTTSTPPLDQIISSSDPSEPLFETPQNPSDATNHASTPPSNASFASQDSLMLDLDSPEPRAVEEDQEELEEARNLLRPRTPNPYVAVFRR